MVKHLGFTGTRQGLSPYQKSTLVRLYSVLRPEVLHVGGAAGADLDATNLFPSPKVEIYPSNLEVVLPKNFSKIWPPKHPLDRNRDIVKASDALVACPKGNKEELRSGTWATVRYARIESLPIVIIFPDGNIGGSSLKLLGLTKD